MVSHNLSHSKKLIHYLTYWFEGNLSRHVTIYIVGGSVRDYVMNRQCADIDLVCKDAYTLAKKIARKHSAALVCMEKKVDEPCYRVVNRNNTNEYLDIAELKGETIQDDLYKRDFTINAMAIQILKDCSLGPIIDPFNGLRDIQQKIIQTLSPETFINDPLRILRVVRFSSQLNFQIDNQTLHQMTEKAHLLRQIPFERITFELKRILVSNRSFYYMAVLDHCGILDILFPEIIPMKGCQQNAYHHLDVWHHSLLTLKQCDHIIHFPYIFFPTVSSQLHEYLNTDERVQLLKFAALFHDIGKPNAKQIHQTSGRVIFYNHDTIGTQIMQRIVKRLKISIKQQDFICNLVKEHLHVKQLSAHDVKKSTIMRWLRNYGDHCISMIILGLSDILSSHGIESQSYEKTSYIQWARTIATQYYEKTKAVIETKNFITGHDLMALGMIPGPEIGALISQIRAAQDQGDIQNREQGLILAKQLIHKFI